MTAVVDTSTVDAGLASKLTLGKQLGKGGFAVVQAGHWKGVGDVAVKVLHGHLKPSAEQLAGALAFASGEDPELQTSLMDGDATEGDTAFKLFLREALVMAKINHRSLVHCHGIYELPGDFPGLSKGRESIDYKAASNKRWCMVLERCTGNSLSKLLFNQMSSGGKLYTTRDMLSWLRDVAEGMVYLHSQYPCIIHRDLKCENVLLKVAHKKDACVPALITDLGLHVRVGSKRQRQLRRVSLAGSFAAHSVTLFDHNSTTQTDPGIRSGTIRDDHTSISLGASPYAPLSPHDFPFHPLSPRFCDSAMSAGAVGAGGMGPGMDIDAAQESPVFLTPSAAELQGLAVPDDLCAAGVYQDMQCVPDVGGLRGPSVSGRRRVDNILMALVQASASYTAHTKPHDPKYDNLVVPIHSTSSPQLIHPPSRTSYSVDPSPSSPTSISSGHSIGCGHTSGAGDHMSSGGYPHSPTDSSYNHTSNSSLTQRQIGEAVTSVPGINPTPFLTRAPLPPMLVGSMSMQRAPSRLGALPALVLPDRTGSSGLLGTGKITQAASGASERNSAATSPRSHRPAGHSLEKRASHQMQQQSVPVGTGFARLAPARDASSSPVPPAHNSVPSSIKSGMRQSGTVTCRQVKDYPSLSPQLSNDPNTRASAPSRAVRFQGTSGDGSTVDKTSNNAVGDVGLQRMSVASAAPSDWGEVMTQIGFASPPNSGGAGLNGLARSALAYLSPEELAWVYSLTGGTGSHVYMAPEVQKREPYNEKIDVFSFGVIAYELLSRSLVMFTHISTGILPGVETPELYAEVVAAGFRPAKPKCTGSVEEQLWALICRCWAQDPNMRPSMQDISILLDVLSQEHENFVDKLTAAAGGSTSRPNGGHGSGGCCSIM